MFLLYKKRAHIVKGGVGQGKRQYIQSWEEVKATGPFCVHDTGAKVDGCWQTSRWQMENPVGKSQVVRTCCGQ